MQKSFREQLAQTTGRSFMGQKVFNQIRYAYEEHMKLATRWQGDCIDHVNICKDAKSELGRVLEPSFRLRFVHDVFGELNSISDLWSMLDNYVGQRSTTLPDVELKFILADAFWQRLNQFPDIAEKLKAETRPFDMYRFNDSGFPNRTSIARWWLEVVNVCRNALVNGKDYPNFKTLVEGKEKRRRAILTYFLEQYIPNRKDTQIKAEGRIDGEEAPAAEEPKKPEPSLIQTVRSKPPVLANFRPFLKPLPPKTGAALDPDALRIKPKKEEPVQPEKTEVPAATSFSIGEGQPSSDDFSLNLGEVAQQTLQLGEIATIGYAGTEIVSVSKHEGGFTVLGPDRKPVYNLAQGDVVETAAVETATAAEEKMTEEVIPPVELEELPVIQPDYEAKLIAAVAKVFEQKSGKTLDYFGITPKVSVTKVPGLEGLQFSVKMGSYEAGSLGSFDPEMADQQTFDGIVERAADSLLWILEKQQTHHADPTVFGNADAPSDISAESASGTPAVRGVTSFTIPLNEFGQPYGSWPVAGSQPVAQATPAAEQPAPENAEFSQEVAQFDVERLSEIVFEGNKTPQEAAAAIAEYVQKETQFVQNNELGTTMDVDFDTGMVFTVCVVSDKGGKAIEVTVAPAPAA